MVYTAWYQSLLSSIPVITFFTLDSVQIKDSGSDAHQEMELLIHYKIMWQLVEGVHPLFSHILTYNPGLFRVRAVMVGQVCKSCGATSHPKTLWLLKSLWHNSNTSFFLPFQPTNFFSNIQQSLVAEQSQIWTNLMTNYHKVAKTSSPISFQTYGWNYELLYFVAHNSDQYLLYILFKVTQMNAIKLLQTLK